MTGKKNADHILQTWNLIDLIDLIDSHFRLTQVPPVVIILILVLDIKTVTEGSVMQGAHLLFHLYQDICGGYVQRLALLHCIVLYLLCHNSRWQPEES